MAEEFGKLKINKSIIVPFRQLAGLECLQTNECLFRAITNLHTGIEATSQDIEFTKVNTKIFCC